jgi:ATP-binding cassette subfamily B protein RaxB
MSAISIASRIREVCRDTFHRVPVIMQSETSECGLACLAMIASYHGRQTSLRKLKQTCRASSDGITLYNMMMMGQDLGLTARPLQLELTHLKELKLPAVILWNRAHFVVLERVSVRGISIVDPGVGRRTYSWDETTVWFSGIALELTPAFDFKPEKKENQQSWLSFRSLTHDNPSLWRLLIPMLILAAIVQLTVIASPKFISLLTDEVIVKNDIDLLELLLYAFGTLYLTQWIAGWLRYSIEQHLRVAVTHETTSGVMNWLTRLPVRFFDSRSAADILRRMRSADSLYLQFTEGWWDIALDVFFAIIFVCLMGFIHARLAAITVLICCLFFIVRFLSVPWLENKQKAILEAETRRDVTLLKMTENIESMKIYGDEAARQAEWSNQQAEAETLRAKVDRVQRQLQTLHQATRNGHTLVIGYLGVNAVLDGESTLGALFVFLLYKDMFMDLILRTVDRVVTLRMLKVELSRVDDILDNEPEPYGEKCYNGLDADRRIHTLEADNLIFHYGTWDDPIVNGVSLSLKQGEKVAIYGASGCGKSTLLRLLVGLYSPDSGRISINDVNLVDYGQRHYRERIAFVSGQEDIRDGSVTENIVFDFQRYDEQLMLSCVQRVNLLETILALPNGFNTHVGNTGVRLSSGQKQRLLLARALYRQPNILFLDEPTSHLDNVSRQAVAELIRSLEETTCVVVTHDDSLLPVCNRSFHMRNGQIQPIAAGREP